MKSSEPLRGFSGSRRYTLTVIPPLPQPVTTALAAGRLTHALCLEAPSPALLRDTAIALAGALLCREGNGSLCRTCPACRKVLVGEHPDLMLYDPDEDKDIYKKESLRRLRAELYRTPVEAPRKVAILQLAERIPAEGQNLLLKIIEEPPERVLFILTCNNRARILPTILSRAAVIPIAVCSQEECLRALGRLAPQADEQRRQQAAEFAQGNIGKALQILQDEAKLKLACDARRIGQMICIGQEFELLSSLQEYTGGKKREEFLALLQEVRAYFLELMRVQSGVTCAHEEIPLAVKNRFSTLQAMRILDIIDRTAAQVTQNVSLSLAAAAFCAGAKAAQQ